MSRGPLIFGYPAWTGLKQRVGKTHLSRDFGFRHCVLVVWRDGKVGDLYRDCSGLNRRLAAVVPEYAPVGKGKGQVLWDLELLAEDGSTCSFKHCGVEPPLSYEQAERYRASLVRRELARGDPDGLAIRWSPEVMTIHPDGTFTIDFAALDERQRRDAQARVTGLTIAVPVGQQERGLAGASPP
jgi:hypothetical protein